MPAAKTRADSLVLYLTGAASDGGAQADPDAALGNYRGSTEVIGLTVSGITNITGLSNAFASGNNGAGTGTLEFDTTNGLRWTAPSGTVGAWVAVAADGDFMMEDGTDPNSYLRVTVTFASLPGANQSDSVLLVDAYNKQYDNVSESEASAGDTEYRALGAMNDNAGSITTVKVWIDDLGIADTTTSATYAASGAVTVTVVSTTGYPDSGYILNETTSEKLYYTSKTATTFVVPSTGRAQFGTSAVAGGATDTIAYCPPFRIGTEAPAGDFIQTIANESTAPAAISFSQPMTEAAALVIGDLPNGDWYGLWLERIISASASSIVDLVRGLKFSFGAA